MLIAGYTSARELLREEIAELEYEGFVIPERVREAFAMLHPEADACNESAIRKIYRLLDGASRRPDWEWVEPDDLEAIRRERPSGPRRFETAFSDEELLDRYYGAWQGRSVGCALGKPVDIEYIDMPETLRDRYQYYTRAEMGKLFSLGWSRPAASLDDAVADYLKNYLVPGKYLGDE